MILRKSVPSFDLSIRTLKCAHCDIDYVVQGHRYDIVEDIGCLPYVTMSILKEVITYSFDLCRTTYIVPLSVPLLLMWPMVLGTISMCYSSQYCVYQGVNLFFSFVCL